MTKHSISKLAVVVLLPLLVISCKKDDAVSGTASLSILNMMRGANPLIPNFTGTSPIPYYSAPRLNFNSFTLFQNRYNSFSGAQSIGFFRLPDTTDKSNPVLLCNVDLPVGSVHSLFLIGTVDNPDYFFVKDNVPHFPATDSAGGFRFVNVLANNGPISVNIKDSAIGSTVQSLAYKEASDFIRYKVKPGVANYVFEFRDLATGDLIISYTTPGLNLFPQGQVNQWIWRCNTITLTGDRSLTGTNGPTVVRSFNF